MSAIGQTFDGYKGGQYTMQDYSTAWLSEYGETGETLGPILLSLMLAQGRVPPDPGNAAATTVVPM